MAATKIYVPRETSAVSVGADEVALAIARAAKQSGGKRKQDPPSSLRPLLAREEAEPDDGEQVLHGRDGVKHATVEIAESFVDRMRKGWGCPRKQRRHKSNQRDDSSNGCGYSHPAKHPTRK